MNTNTTEGIESCPHERSTVTQEDFAALEERVKTLEQEKDERISELEETVARQSEEIEELKEELKEERETRAKEAAQDRKRLHEVEERLDSVEEGDSGDEAPTPTPETGETTIQEPETPLEDIIRVPEHLVEESLSANQQRARFVAKDAHEYTRSVPAGRVIKSSELRRILSAGEESRVYTETVSRVINFLTDLGKDSVKLRETREGERVIVFTDEFVKRVVAWKDQSNSVVTGGGATG